MLTEDKGLAGIVISILGTDYTIRCVKATEMPSWFFENNKGYCDHTVKIITVEDLVERKDDYNDVLSDLEMITDQAVRHEIIHAFLRESGLGDESDMSETLVDWFALQAPKIFQAFCQAKALSSQDFRLCTEAFVKANTRGDKSNVVTGITNGN